uniref:VanZ-like domain-containing protein n=1 Tax=Magnetococcus massalia (strain MO-1) TaxID=451514 RepID=A0A1S7LP51_MAGMO|nr:conserved membrane protein of unknown function. putative VanZ like protein [Candidatus Magnetococcus massalia]
MLKLPTSPIWRWTLGYTLLIYLSLPFMPMLVDNLYQSLGRAETATLLAALFGALTMGLWIQALRAAPHWWQSFAPFMPIALAAGIGWVGLENPMERVHLAQYAILGALLQRATHGCGSQALSIALAIGVGDEAIQYLLPNRYWDLRDVAMNGFGALIGIWAAVNWPGQDETTEGSCRL